MYLFGVYDFRLLFSDKMYGMVKITFPIRDTSNINTITTIAAITPVDKQLQLDGNNVLSKKDDNASALILIAKQFYNKCLYLPSTVSCMLSLSLLCSTYCCPDDGSTVAMQVMVLPLSHIILNRLIRRVSPVIV